MVEITDIHIPGYDRVVRMQDPEAGLDGFIAVHSTVMGPALGGLRFRSYSDSGAALADVLRLSEAMTYKAAAAGLPFGGGKAVVIGNPRDEKTPQLLERIADAVNELNGEYITAEDVGTSADNLVEVAKTTRWVAGLPNGHGGSGDPSPATAEGVLSAMHAAARVIWHDETLEDRRIVVQGIGKVGAALVERLYEEGALVSVADIDGGRAAEISSRLPGVESIAAEGCLRLEADIVAPCAWGGVLTESTVPELRCHAVVGSANNQLHSRGVSAILADREIAYVPDFIANAGGIINIASEFGYDDADVARGIARIGDTTERILRDCYHTKESTHESAIGLAHAQLGRS